MPQWVCYKTKQSGNKLDKIMKSPVTNLFAYSNDKSTWADIYTALRYMDRHNMDGLAFALQSGITFIDLDHVRNPDTKEIINTAAKDILSSFPRTYTELSASGTGIHIICLGSLPTGGRNRNDNFGVDIEMYDNRRFVCFTGSVWDNRNALLECTEQVAELNRKYLGTRPKQPEMSPCSTVTSSDSVLLDKVLRSRQAIKFTNLFAGNYANYGSHSQADSALVWLLAFWTRDRFQIDRIFRASGLYRPKWDRRLYNTTYGEDMINSALQHVKCHRELEAY